MWWASNKSYRWLSSIQRNQKCGVRLLLPLLWRNAMLWRSRFWRNEMLFNVAACTFLLIFIIGIHIFTFNNTVLVHLVSYRTYIHNEVRFKKGSIGRVLWTFHIYISCSGVIKFITKFWSLKQICIRTFRLLQIKPFLKNYFDSKFRIVLSIRFNSICNRCSLPIIFLRTFWCWGLSLQLFSIFFSILPLILFGAWFCSLSFWP